MTWNLVPSGVHVAPPPLSRCTDRIVAVVPDVDSSRSPTATCPSQGQVYSARTATSLAGSTKTRAFAIVIAALTAFDDPVNVNDCSRH